jgi:hypothetical protein
MCQVPSVLQANYKLTIVHFNDGRQVTCCPAVYPPDILQACYIVPCLSRDGRIILLWLSFIMCPMSLQCTLAWSQPTQAPVRARALTSQMEPAMVDLPGVLLPKDVRLECGCISTAMAHICMACWSNLQLQTAKSLTVMSNSSIDMRRMTAVVKDIKAKATNDVLVLDAGDQFTGTGGRLSLADHACSAFAVPQHFCLLMLALISMMVLMCASWPHFACLRAETSFCALQCGMWCTRATRRRPSRS